jgi:transposase
MTLRALLEKSADVDLLREMVGFAAQRANALAELRRDTARLRLVEKQIAEIEGAGRDGLARADAGHDPAADMVRALSRVVGVGVETAELLAREILLRNLRDRRAVARYAGLIGSPDESGPASSPATHRDEPSARAGNFLNASTIRSSCDG